MQYLAVSDNEATTQSNRFLNVCDIMNPYLSSPSADGIIRDALCLGARWFKLQFYNCAQNIVGVFSHHGRSLLYPIHLIVILLPRS